MNRHGTKKLLVSYSDKSRRAKSVTIVSSSWLLPSTVTVPAPAGGDKSIEPAANLYYELVMIFMGGRQHLISLDRLRNTYRIIDIMTQLYHRFNGYRPRARQWSLHEQHWLRLFLKQWPFETTDQDFTDQDEMFPPPTCCDTDTDDDDGDDLEEELDDDE
jgi:hypothetical protein